MQVFSFLHLHHLRDGSRSNDDSVLCGDRCCDDAPHAGNPVDVPLSDCWQKREPAPLVGKKRWIL